LIIVKAPKQEQAAVWYFESLVREGMNIDFLTPGADWNFLILFDDDRWTFSYDGAHPNVLNLDLHPPDGLWHPDEVNLMDDIVWRAIDGAIKPDIDFRIKCECGGDKLKLPHSTWCDKYE